MLLNKEILEEIHRNTYFQKQKVENGFFMKYEVEMLGFLLEIVLVPLGLFWNGGSILLE